MLRELVLDTETTGLDPKSNHRLIELACVELVNHIPTGAHWHWYFNPERDVPKAATDVHGLTGEFLADKPLFRMLADEVYALIREARLIIHNAAFDVAFLNHEFGNLGYPAISFDQVVDTLALARRKHPGSPNSLDALCRRYGIDNSTRVKHGALLDCELLAEVYLRLIGAEQAGLDFSSLSKASADAVVHVSYGRREKPLASRLTDAEIAAHQKLITTLGKPPIWSNYQDVRA